MDHIYIEFGGDPSDDKEVYKRYSSRNIQFEPLQLNDEVIDCVRYDDYQKLETQVSELKFEIERYKVLMQMVDVLITNDNAKKDWEDAKRTRIM